MAVCKAVYHKFVLRNHHMQHAMFKRNANRLYWLGYIVLNSCVIIGMSYIFRIILG